ncbi:MAG TPA: redox-regulated ATPase YchF [Syntrophomonadaceae bacterium]|nr:redox-regulated ATPase YchF [Syntrophomonadaceae bacterium]
MQLGIIGMPKVGKTTIFELLTASQVKDTSAGKTNIGMARVPDSRIDYLSGIYKPKKTTYAQLEVVDVPGLVPGSEKAASNFLEAVRKADALLLVVRAFEDDAFQGVMDEINPLKEIDSIRFELLMADLDLVEKRIDRIHNSKKKNQMQEELDVLEQLKQNLENEVPVSAIKLDESQLTLLQNYLFLTAKPLFICVNLPEDRISNPEYHRREDLLLYAKDLNIPLAELSAEIEKEINRMEGEDKQMFMDDTGIKESGIVKIARSMYHLLGLISFFTVGEDEVKAWTIEEGTRARKAAGKIHSDIERGFIRAEVFAFDAFQEYKTMAALKEKGLLRLEGKEYPVKDGDIVHYRFNV